VLTSHNHAAWPPSPPRDPLLLVLESDRTASVLGPAPLADLCAGRWVGVLAGPRVELRAEIVDEASGAPVRGRVSLFVTVGGDEGVPLCGWGSRSDEQGRVALHFVRGGPWMVRAEAEGFAPASIVVTPPADGLVRIALRRIVDRIPVRVLDAQGAPRAGMDVCVVDPDHFHVFQATTDRDGRAMVGVPRPAEYFCYLAMMPDAREHESVSNPERVTVGTGEVLFRIVPSVVVTFDMHFADGTVPDPVEVRVRGPAGRLFSTGWGWSPTTPECTLPDEPCEIDIIASSAKSVTIPFPGSWDREAPIRITLERE
jgi:hypothetical protein